jgi:hypothetical protein
MVVGAAVVLSACGGSSSDGGEGVGAAEGGDASEAVARDEVAGTDLTTHEVPLEDVVFDTFDGGSIPLSEASEDDVLRLRDAIIPIGEPEITPDNPKPVYVGPNEDGARDLQPDDAVLGYVTPEGQAFAYPHRILFQHEIVNDTLGGVPTLVSFCPLCNSGVVFDRRLPDGTELGFGNTSALYENDLVMYDRQTFSYWWQVPGRAIVGELSGTALEVLPSTTTTWREWLELHPDTKVLSLDQGFGRDYQPVTQSAQGIGAAADAGETPFPIDPKVLADERLPSSTNVIGVEVDGDARAFPVTGEPEAAHDTVGGEKVVVLLSADGGAAFRPMADGRELTFEVAPGGNGWVDTQTGTRWDGTGRGVEGQLEGTQLEQLPSRSTFWFAYLSSFPDVTVWMR